MSHRLLNALWLPTPRKVHRVIWHWTAGQYRPSAFDRAHYHFTVDGLGLVAPHPLGVRPGSYLPHCLNLNTGSVGIAVCAMAGAVEGKTPYRVPVTELQIERLCQATAEVLHAYRLALTERTALCHSEVERVYGTRQRGKWDIDAVAGEGVPTQRHELHEWMRRKTAWYLERLRA